MVRGPIDGAGHLGCGDRIFIGDEIRQLTILRVRKSLVTTAIAVLQRSSLSEDGGRLNDASR